MSNLTKDKIHETTVRAGIGSYIAANGVTFYAGGLVGINAAGYLAKWADTAGHKFLGLLLEGVVGNTSASPKKEGRVDESGTTLTGVTISGAAQSDVNAPVYCTSDNAADLSLTPTDNVRAIGWVSRYVTTDTVDVTLFTPEEYAGGADLSALTALVDNSGGAAADGTIAAVAATPAATAGGATPTAAQVDAGIALAVATIVSGVNNAVKELATRINAITAR